MAFVIGFILGFGLASLIFGSYLIYRYFREDNALYVWNQKERSDKLPK